MKDSLSQKPDTSPEPTMLTPYQQELLRQLEREIDEFLAQSPHLNALLARLKATAQTVAKRPEHFPPDDLADRLAD
ncbi:MAG: hypothetical protein MOB07_02305 [Acidobacteria bacterium]|nr:hypothetical protein [Acidobacteriota bacterium]